MASDREQLKHPTMRDVAQRAGVGTITVSRALKNPQTVSEERRARIHAAMAELNYIPNSIAGTLSSMKSSAVVILVPNVADATFADTIQGITDVLNGAGRQILLGTSRYSMEVEEELLRLLLAWRPAGIFITGKDHTPSARKLLQQMQIPVVEFWDVSDNPIDVSVGFSHFRIGYDITKHVVACGARRIVFVRGSYDAANRAQTREEGYRSAMQELALEDLPALLPAPGPIGISGGGDAMRQIFDEGTNIDAAIFGSDYPAAGAIFECQRRGVSIPDEIMIAGIGDYEIAAQIHPSLTSVRMPRYEVGKQAGELMLARLANEPVDERVVVLDTPLVIRQSTGG